MTVTGMLDVRTQMEASIAHATMDLRETELPAVSPKWIDSGKNIELSFSFTRL